MDGQTERCAHCGTPSTEGRFCTNCGAELGTEPTNPRVWTPGGTDTAERPYDVPTPAYARSGAGRPAPAYRAPVEPAYLAPTPEGRTRSALGPGVWIALAAAMALVLALGVFLLFHGSGSPTATAATGGSGHGSTSTSSSGPDPSSSGPSSSTPSSSGSSSSPTRAVQVKGPPTDVAGFAQVSAPSHAPAGVDFQGRRVTYVAANMVDGRNDTCWRTPGDATGTVITFRLDQPTRITRVGLVNGYSKIAYSHGRAYDWYLGNRLVMAVDWTFDDGSTVSQTFGKSRVMQQTAVQPVTTRTVRLRITSVTPPGKGRAARNDTAISEVLLLGRTAS